MDKEIAEAAMKFMMRTQLTGQEVPAFNAVMQALAGFVDEKVDPDASHKGDGS